MPRNSSSLQPPAYSLPLIIDNFAGGGGASSGIEAALGRAIDIAINHDPAAAQGFPADYKFPPVQSTAIRLIGNSVCPPVAEALVRANLPEQCAERVVA
jgi:site-specific DNA-cytosine methylase